MLFILSDPCICHGGIDHLTLKQLKGMKLERLLPNTSPVITSILLALFLHCSCWMSRSPCETMNQNEPKFRTTNFCSKQIHHVLSLISPPSKIDAYIYSDLSLGLCMLGILWRTAITLFLQCFFLKNIENIPHSPWCSACQIQCPSLDTPAASEKGRASKTLHHPTSSQNRYINHVANRSFVSADSQQKSRNCAAHTISALNKSHHAPSFTHSRHLNCIFKKKHLCCLPLAMQGHGAVPLIHQISRP